MSRHFRRNRSAQTAIADAVIALVILSVASTVIYSAVSATVSDRSAARQRSDLRTVAMQSAGLPLEASYPSASYKEIATGKVHSLLDRTGEDILKTLFELRSRDNGTVKLYDLSGLEKALEDLYRWTFEGRSYAVHIQGTLNGQVLTMLFSSGGAVAITKVSDIPDPRIVVQRTVHDNEGDISVDLYLWQ